MKRIPSLDGLRAISILLVVFGHLSERHIIDWKIWSFYPTTGVRIFFVISGYLITQILIREQQATGTISLKTFYLRRAFRIFPAAVVFVIIVTIVYWPELRWYHIGTALFYLANVGVPPLWFFGHLWSLSLEEQFYLLWPAILRRWPQSRTCILVTTMLFAPCFTLFLYSIHARRAFFASFPANADALAFGCVLAVIAPRLPRIRSYWACAMLIAGIFIPMFPDSSVWRTTVNTLILRPMLQICISGLLLYAVQRQLWLLNTRPVTWLGRISYSLYLWQQPFCFAPYLNHRYVLGFALLCACVSYYLVEQPMLRLREKFYCDSAFVLDISVPEPQTNAA